MLYFKVDRPACKAEVASKGESRNDWRTFEAAQEVARLAGDKYIATDSGPWVSPRYDVIEMFKVGEPVSYGFNGDSYPCGTVTAISASQRIITTSEGQKFYRRKLTGSWKMQGTWSLCHGHISKTNPEF